MSPRITSLQNPRIKNATKLRHRRAREKQRRIIIDGIREIRCAASAGVEFVELFHCPQIGDPQAHAELLALTARTGVEHLEVDARVFERLEFGKRGDGIVAVAKTPNRTLDAIVLDRRPLIVVLESVEKPGNVGAAIRTADGAGASAVIVADAATDLFNPNTIRASLGAVFTMPVGCASSRDVKHWLAEQQVTVVTAVVDATTNYDEYDFTQPTAMILGSEATGLADVWRREIESVRLPMQGNVDSLNVSATAAVLLYEANRQRRRAGG